MNKKMRIALFSLVYLMILIAGPANAGYIRANDERITVSVIQCFPEQHIGSLNGAYESTEIVLMDTCHDCSIGRARIVALSQHHYYLDLLFIKEEYRGQRYGTRLFNFVCSYLKDQDIRVISWIAQPVDIDEVSERWRTLTNLIGFYEKLGGTVAAVHPDHDNAWACMFVCLQPCDEATKRFYEQQLTDWWLDDIWPEAM
jgi:GNAT superfamily N-acetyltransferase